MNTVTLDLMSRCQATIRRRDIVTGLGWFSGRKKLHCLKEPLHLGLHTFEERA